MQMKSSKTMKLQKLYFYVDLILQSKQRNTKQTALKRYKTRTLVM